MINIGSAKDLIIDDTPAGKSYLAPETDKFGRGAWRANGRFSVADLKELIPETRIRGKAEAISMMNAAFFEWFFLNRPYHDIKTCYIGLLDKDGRTVGLQELLDKGETTDTTLMRLAHVPSSYSDGDLAAYRNALASGELLCGVADIESIFRKGIPLGSSVFEKIFSAVGKGEEYNLLSTYEETATGLGVVRTIVDMLGAKNFPALEEFLSSNNLMTIPNPGFILEEFRYNTTTKFESAGDREIGPEDAQRFSGLDADGYLEWTRFTFPTIAQAQIDFCDERGIINMDGKCECVAFRRNPVLTDFCCTIDENRLMILHEVDGEQWAIPTNKEIQRAIFRSEGVYAAINVAKEKAEKEGQLKDWKVYLPRILDERNIDLSEVAEHSCRLMEYATAEVANRILGRNVFETRPIDQWVQEFLPYASKVSYPEKEIQFKTEPLRK